MRLAAHEVAFVGENGQARCPGPLVGRRDVGGIEFGANDAFAGGCALDFRDHRGVAGLDRLGEAAGRGGGLGVSSHVGEGPNPAPGSDLGAFVLDDLAEYSPWPDRGSLRRVHASPIIRVRSTNSLSFSDAWPDAIKSWASTTPFANVVATPDA